MNVRHDVFPIRINTRCTILTGPVSGSLLMHNCIDCTVIVAARQFRIHHAESCTFLIHALSRPIIEHCKGLRFAPYPVQYNGLPKQLEEAGLLRKSSTWRNVDDFRWLRRQHSPNWELIPAENLRDESIRKVERNLLKSSEMEKHALSFLVSGFREELFKNTEGEESGFQVRQGDAGGN